MDLVEELQWSAALTLIGNLILSITPDVRGRVGDVLPARQYSLSINCYFRITSIVVYFLCIQVFLSSRYSLSI